MLGGFVHRPPNCPGCWGLGCWLAGVRASAGPVHAGYSTSSVSAPGGHVAISGDPDKRQDHPTLFRKLERRRDRSTALEVASGLARRWRPRRERPEGGLQWFISFASLAGTIRSRAHCPAGRLRSAASQEIGNHLPRNWPISRAIAGGILAGKHVIVLSRRRQSHIAALACLRRLLSRPSLSAGATAHEKGRSGGYHLPGRVPLPPEKTEKCHRVGL